ncbi:hypothetical protein [Amycolatopsis nigrescens]|uniref:hypothetical protein n=1 Tax=Amycolatopsis nigrescens TaxID=381445 RepID=UPI0003752E16|nr:hypothetical protein [Amycolatopsis nigrescens]
MNTNTIGKATPTVSYRGLAMLRAVGAGRAQVSCSSEPDLFIDGVSCCDQFTAHTLAHQGLLRPKRPGALGQRVPAALTSAGLAIITAQPVAA